jgi:DNA replication protein DnaC
MTSTKNSFYEHIANLSSAIGVAVKSEEIALLAEKCDMGESELKAVASTFDYLDEKQHETTIATMLRLSRIPRKNPKTFDNFDFGRIQGRDAAALKNLPALTNLHAGKNIAFIGPHGIGKTHLAQAYGRECCINGYKTYYIKATELKSKLEKIAYGGNTGRTVNGLVVPSCLIIDEIGRCTYDRKCTDLFFDIVDRRYEKDGPNTLILTSNTPVVNWDQFFTGDDTLLCTLDRIFDRASVFVMKGASYRGAGCETFSVEACPVTEKVKQ